MNYRWKISLPAKDKKKKTNVEIILSRSGKKNFIPFLFLFRNLLLAVQLPIHFRLRNYRNCSINRSERERERDTIHVKISLVRRLVCTGRYISRLGGPMFYGAAEFTSGRFTRTVSGSGQLLCRGFYVSLGIEVWWILRYKIEIQDLAKKCASVNY